MRVRLSFFFASSTSPARQDRCSTWPRVDADLVATTARSGPVTAPVAIATARARALSAFTSVHARASINASRPVMVAVCQRSKTASAASSLDAAGWTLPRSA